MTSSNYDDSEKKVTGGRNGFGAKLCNIFSTKFSVETVNKRKGKKFKQTWTGNMKQKATVKITDCSQSDYTKASQLSCCPKCLKGYLLIIYNFLDYFSSRSVSI